MNSEGGCKQVRGILDNLPPPNSGGMVQGQGGCLSGQPSNSKLWEKNKMLASLLAKQPSTPTTIPPIPASVISATPQDKLPRIIKTPGTSLLIT
jgi:hypothetical protein